MKPFLRFFLAGLFLIPVSCLLFSGCSSLNFLYKDAEKYSHGNTELTEKVENLDLSWVSGSVKILYHDRNTVKLCETSSSALSEDTSVHWFLDGTTLRIRFLKSGTYRFLRLAKDLTLTLPKDFAAKNVEISLASADFETEALRSEKIEISSASGDVSLTSAATGKLEISSASGKINLIQKENCPKIKLNTASGSIRADVLQAGDLSVNTASGKVEIRGTSFGDVSVDSASGDVQISVIETLSECNIDTASGEVTLFLPEKMGFTAEIETGSGRFESALALRRKGKTYIAGDGEAKIEIDTASGDIFVKKAG